MRATAIILVLAAAMAAVARAADEGSAFPYDPAKTPTYLGQALAGPAAAAAPAATAELRKELSAMVDEVLDGPWLPLYSDYSAAQAGGVGPAEWCFNRPGEYTLALAQAAAYMTDPQKAKARTFLKELISTCPPTRQVYLPIKEGKARTIRQAPTPKNPWLSAPDSERMLFGEAYAVWSFASAFDAWDDARPMLEDLKKLRAQLEARDDFAPTYKPEHAGPLTAADAKDPAYRFGVYQALLAGFQDNYWYHGALEARERMQKDKPVFFYVRTLSALVGYYRLAQHAGQADEAAWASQTFDKVAAMAVGQQSAPFLWSDPSLCPEVARLLRDAAGPWLDELAKTPNVGNLPATDWGNKPVPGRWDHYVMNPYTWYHAWGGQGEGIRPRTVMGAFLANAWLLNAPPAAVAQTVDIPWCKADLYYVGKLVAAIQAAEKPGWVAVK
jgi:hypothetical protein